MELFSTVVFSSSETTGPTVRDYGRGWGGGGGGSLRLILAALNHWHRGSSNTEPFSPRSIDAVRLADWKPISQMGHSEVTILRCCR